MVILRLGGGQANQMYSFAAAYALAKARNEELVLDISACLTSVWSYQLDYFRIPNVKKILYRNSDAENLSHTSTANIPASLLANGKAYSDTNPELPSYEGIAQANTLEGDPIILCGYFFPRARYYSEYWDEVRRMFVPLHPAPFLQRFSSLTEGYDAVGIHIRRGDFLYADYAFKPEGNFFRAAVNWYRSMLKRPRFFVFSDDSAYAKSVIGQDSNIYYIHCFGLSEAPLLEFLCLAACSHKVLSNDSTFSNLAYDVNDNPQKTALRRTRPEDEGRYPPLSGSRDKFLTRLEGATTGRNFYMDTAAMQYWAQISQNDGKNALGDYKALILDTIRCEDDVAALDKIDTLCLNAGELEKKERMQIAYRKFVAHARLGQCDAALDLAYSIWHDFDSLPEFHRYYAEMLRQAGFEEEAAVEASRCRSDDAAIVSEKIRELYTAFTSGKTYRFLIVPYTKMMASGMPVGLVTLGIVLRRLGHKVTFLLKTGSGTDEDRAETAYIYNNKLLTTRAGVCLGCEQFQYEATERAGLIPFLQRFCNAGPERHIIVSRDPGLCAAADSLKLPFVYGGFPRSDAETPSGMRLPEENRSFMENRAAYVLPRYAEEEKEYTVFSDRWTERQELRLIQADIHRAASLLNWVHAADERSGRRGFLP